MVKQYQIRLYQNEDFALWNDFISKAKNATFLFHRNFMEYHNDRFDDYSLMVFDENKLVAVLPANRVNNALFSHQGLTYGGLVLLNKSKLSDVISIFKTLLQFLSENGIEKINLKTIPSFYCDDFSEELEYCMFLLNAQLVRRDALSVLHLKKTIKPLKTRLESIRRGEKKGLVIKEESNFELFWNQILIPNLDKKHQSKPVHTFKEMERLHQNFPDNIRQFNVYYNDEIVAGTTMFLTNKVAHPQYISGNEKKNELGSLDYLYYYLITEVFKDKSYFDFGPSHEDNGRKIKEGILFWKESFGAKTTIQNFYEIETQNYPLLETVLL